MDYRKLGKRIRDERTRQYTTQEQLAEAIELSAVYVGQIERSERKLSIDTLVKIANALHVSVESLIRDSVEQNSEILDNELIALIKDRTREEKSLILDTVKAVLSHVKDNAIR